MNSHEEWLHKQVEALEEIINKCHEFNSISTTTAIKSVKQSGKYEDEMFFKVER